MLVQLLVTVEEGVGDEPETADARMFLEDMAARNVYEAIADHPHIRRVAEVVPMNEVAFMLGDEELTADATKRAA